MPQAPNSPAMLANVPNWCIVAEIFMVLPVGSVENERLFLQMELVKDDLRASLGDEHLNTALIVKVNGGDPDKFPYAARVRKWKALATKRGRYREGQALAEMPAEL